MAGTFDDRIKNLNAKIERIKRTFGPQSSFYQEMVTKMSAIFGFKNMVKEGKAQFRLTRSKNSTITTSQIEKMENMLEHHSLADMKKEAATYLREEGKKGRIKIADYRKAAEDITQIKSDYKEMVEALYKWEHASDEAAFIIAEARQKGKKSYAQLMSIMRRARQADANARSAKLKPDARAVSKTVMEILNGKSEEE